MAIQILPPQLANQIAAGEVVERPASVVKELVENCLDAGATKIDIEIEKGGAKLIRIQDNGCGISKTDLALALSRHATSKLHTLDDLEAILSFGFRGEALASISSVSRLTLTSRTEEQAEAWMAYAEGSEMAVKIQPAAHPIGTTIDVVDLFFNTPARRRFLKSDKTEFAHIDEWLKRMALVRPDIQLTLKHNGKQVRHYRPANTDNQFLQRLTQVAGRSFAEQAVKVECNHEELQLSGYLQSPQQSELQDIHYFYVNGRLVRDRLVNHAVRQAFADLNELEQPGYVLMLQLDPHQVDVNVHPAKHEVRFHQARYVHDFILQALTSALEQSVAISAVNEPFIKPQLSENPYIEREVASAPSSSGKRDYSAADVGNAVGGWNSASSGSREYYPARAPSRSALQSYGALLTTPGEVNEGSDVASKTMPPLLDGQYWVLVEENNLRLLPVKHVAEALRYQQIVNRISEGLPAQPLLMPVAIEAAEEWKKLLLEHEPLIKRLGLELNIRYQQLIIKKVPPYLRDTQLAIVIPELLQQLLHGTTGNSELAQWLASKSSESYISAPITWQTLCLLDDAAQAELLKLGKALPWRHWLEQQRE